MGRLGRVVGTEAQEGGCRGNGGTLEEGVYGCVCAGTSKQRMSVWQNPLQVRFLQGLVNKKAEIHPTTWTQMVAVVCHVLPALGKYELYGAGGSR